MRKATRGRPSKIDLLPDDAREFVAAAINALKSNDRTQEDIREELNNHLLSLGYAPVSRSSFHRKSLYIAANGADLLHAREVAAMMAEKLNEAPEGDVGLLLNETIKSLVYDVVMEQRLSGESISISMLQKCADAIMRLERARKTNVETATKIRTDFFKKADKAVVEASKKAGLSKDQVAQIRREVLGVVKK